MASDPQTLSPTDDGKFETLLEQADKEILWSALYRILESLYYARAEDPACVGEEESRGGLYSVTHMTADFWAAPIPGMPNADAIAKDARADDAHRDLAYWAEQRGLRITGDEFI